MVSDIFPHGGREDIVERYRYMMAAGKQGKSSSNGQGRCSPRGMCLAIEVLLTPTTALPSLEVPPPPQGWSPKILKISVGSFLH